MNVRTLLRLVAPLPEKTPVLAATLEAHIKGGERTVWYRTQKEHLHGWLRAYDGPGAYNRKGGPGRDAKFFYNHFQCASGLLWLAEAAGVPRTRLKAGANLGDADASTFFTHSSYG